MTWERSELAQALAIVLAFLFVHCRQLFIVLDRGPDRRKIGAGPSLGDRPAFLFVHGMWVFVSSSVMDQSHGISMR